MKSNQTGRERMQSVEFFSLQRQHAELRATLHEATNRVLGRGQFILGPELERFEQSFADYSCAKYAIGVGNGLDALVLILRSLRVGPGDEVIVPGHTFIATWLAVEQVGASVVPVDVDPDTYNISPARVREAITTRTRAIIAVHLYGQPADMQVLAELSAGYGLALIEDAAQAHGAMYKGRKVGGLATAAAFSFYPTKNLGALGDGGAVTTNDERIATFVRTFRNYGSKVKYQHDELGCNSRLDEVQAACLAAKLAVIDIKNARRREIARNYTERLSEVPGLKVPVVAPDTDPVWHLYVVELANRDAVQKRLSDNGIATMIHYPTPPHRQPAYARTALGRIHLPHTEKAAGHVLSLPMWPELTDEEITRVVHNLARAVRAEGEALTETAQ
jgi:dTDP-3-amino-3,4,6-trideoxy-alpha-D-glucose transaminase